MTSPWLDPAVARAQRALVDQQLQAKPWPPHFTALAEAVRATNCPGEVLFVGAGVGHEREVLDRAGVEYRSFAGIDISPEAIRLARERYPESDWVLDVDGNGRVLGSNVLDRSVDVVVDSACLMHVDDWRAHLAAVCAASRRWVVLHRVPYASGMPLGTGARSKPTKGYGHEFPAWEFGANDLYTEMEARGFELVRSHNADGDSVTLTFARPRHYVSYCDASYLPRLKALHASMVRHAGPFKLHVLAFDRDVADWCDSTVGVVAVEVEDFTAEHPELWLDRLPGPRRTQVEYMWTLGPAFLASVMERTGEPVTYVDADCCLFSSPEPMFAQIGSAAAGIVPHNFQPAARGLPGPQMETHFVFGLYNVGVVHIADRAVAEEWAARCRRWCYDRVERTEFGLQYGDQRYLDSWPQDHGAVVLHPSANVGPWSVHTMALDVRDGVVHFGNRSLISYHFSGYRELPEGHTVLTRPEYQLTERQAEIIYTPYIRALEEAKR